MLRTLKGGIALLIFAAFIAGCSKSSSTGPGSTAPVLKAPTFAGPSSTSASADTSIGAVEAKSIASTFNLISSGYLNWFKGNGVQSGNNWTWTVSNGSGFTATWTASSSSSGYTWSLVYNGTLGNVTYNKATIVSGSESSDGKTGNWTGYYPNSSVIEFQISWATDATGNITGTIVSNDTTGTLQYKYLFTDNKDNSGELKIYEGTAETFDIIWTSTGTGHYTEWDTNGNIISSGPWY